MLFRGDALEPVVGKSEKRIMSRKSSLKTGKKRLIVTAPSQAWALAGLCRSCQMPIQCTTLYVAINQRILWTIHIKVDPLSSHSG